MAVVLEVGIERDAQQAPLAPIVDLAGDVSERLRRQRSTRLDDAHRSRPLGYEQPPVWRELHRRGTRQPIGELRLRKAFRDVRGPERRLVGDERR